MSVKEKEFMIFLMIALGYAALLGGSFTYAFALFALSLFAIVARSSELSKQEHDVLQQLYDTEPFYTESDKSNDATPMVISKDQLANDSDLDIPSYDHIIVNLLENKFAYRFGAGCRITPDGKHRLAVLKQQNNTLFKRMLQRAFSK